MKFGSGSFTIDKDSFCKYLAVLIHGSIYNATMDESFNDFKVDFGLKIHQFRWINQSIRLPGMGLEAEPSEDMELDPTQGKWVWGVFLCFFFPEIFFVVFCFCLCLFFVFALLFLGVVLLF